MMRARWPFGLAVALFICALPATAQTFVFHLRGDQEVPPTASIASGGCFGQFDQPGAQFSVTCVHNVANATVMHIHRGAPGVNGPIVFDLGSPMSPVVRTWTAMTPADIADLLNGNLYINVHTAGRPAGEIRGQILTRTVDVVNFTANGAQYVPPDTATETATCTADLDAAATSLAVQCTHDVSGASAAEIREAPALENGPIVYTFASAASPLSGNVPMTPRLVADYAATFLYLEIHTPIAAEGTPSPQIRGQIGTPPAAPSTGTIRIVKSTVPAGGTAFSFTDNVPGSPGTFTLNDTEVRTFTGVAPGNYTITENVKSGYTVADVACSVDGAGDPFARTATISLHAAETVTCTFHNLQTITAPQSLFVFSLTGDQEVPPIASPGRGGCFGEFDGVNTLELVCTHNFVDATLMHIHRGAAGINGPIIFDLGNPNSPLEATWSGMTANDVADLLSGNLYVNIHTGGRPTGGVRGQILGRTVDSFAFNLDGSQEVPPTSSLATGTCSFNLADDATSLAMQCAHNATAVTNAHLHDAPPGDEGPVVVNLPTTSSFAANVTMTPRLVADFAAGFLYVNVHTTDFPAGEIRGQAIGAPLSNVPTATPLLVLLLAVTLALAAWWRLR